MNFLEYVAYGSLASIVLIFTAKILLYGSLHREEDYYERKYEAFGHRKLTGAGEGQISAPGADSDGDADIRERSDLFGIVCHEGREGGGRDE